MRRLSHWQARVRALVAAIGFLAMLAWVSTASGQQSGQGTVEVLTLREKPQPVATTSGHILAGVKVSGRLVSLTDSGVTVETKGGRVEVPSTEVLDVRFLLPAGTVPALSKPPAAWVRLVDGSLIGCGAVSATPKLAKLQTEQLGPLSIPAAQVSSVRFGRTDRGVIESWRELLGREIKRDRLVILKGKTLDYLDGVVGSIDDKQIKFLLDGDEIPVPRARVYGIIFFRKSQGRAAAGPV